VIERYTLPEMGKIWTESAKFQSWLKVEIAACEANFSLGKIPEVEEYQDITKNKINPYSDELYRYLQFDEIHDFSLSK